MSFAKKLVAYRKQLGLTQSELTRLLEVSPRITWDWEHGTKTPLAVTREGVLSRLKQAKSRQEAL